MPKRFLPPRFTSSFTLILLGLFASVLAAMAAPQAAKTQGAKLAVRKPAATDAPRPAEKILQDAREAIGGEAKLRTVKALLVEGSFSADQGHQNWQTYGFRMLLPDRFQRMDNQFRHTLNGPEFWMVEDDIPVSDDLRRSGRRTTESRFFGVMLTFLLQAPAGFPVQLKSLPTSGVPSLDGEAVEFARTGGSPLTIVFDRTTHLPIGSVGTALLANPSTDSPGQSVPRVVFVQEYQTVDGIRFPHWLDDQMGDQRVLTRILKIVVNPPLTAQDFNKPEK